MHGEIYKAYGGNIFFVLYRDAVDTSVAVIKGRYSSSDVLDYHYLPTKGEMDAASYRQGDVIAIGRNYLAGISFASNKIVFFLPLNKNIQSPGDGSTVTSITASVFSIYANNHAEAYISHVNTIVGYARKNGVDVEVTLDGFPSWLSASMILGIDFRGSITL